MFFPCNSSFCFLFFWFFWFFFFFFLLVFYSSSYSFSIFLFSCYSYLPLFFSLVLFYSDYQFSVLILDSHLVITHNMNDQVGLGLYVYKQKMPYVNVVQTQIWDTETTRHKILKTLGYRYAVDPTYTHTHIGKGYNTHIV